MSTYLNMTCSRAVVVVVVVMCVCVCAGGWWVGGQATREEGVQRGCSPLRPLQRQQRAAAAAAAWPCVGRATALAARPHRPWHGAATLAHLLQRFVPVALLPLVGDGVMQRLQRVLLLPHAQQLIGTLDGALGLECGGCTPTKEAAPPGHRAGSCSTGSASLALLQGDAID